MNVKELKECLESFPDDDVVVIKNWEDGGWANISYIERAEGSSDIDIVVDTEPIFRGE